jgi:hypothetical protein
MHECSVSARIFPLLKQRRMAFLTGQERQKQC